ncbi:MAG: GNAT family N-acetyltransferase [Dermabacter sp.]|nr:GNAT family N-acetyltransferase [Dermabacter sp.]
MTVQTVRESDWEALKELRLGMLSDAPDAYKADPATALRLSESDWRAFASRTNLFVFAKRLPDGEVMGGASIQPVGSPADTPSIALVTSVFVRPEFRGHGVVDRLFEALDTLAMGLGRSRIRLEVSSAALESLARFEALGFRTTGAERPMPGSDEIRLIAAERDVRA